MKTCTNCSAEFLITDSDRQFYQTIDVPEPTLCPDCRQKRRLAWRNERWMYKRKCNFSGKEIISMYPPDSPFKVYTQEIWWSDRWNALDYGRDFDFNRPFFEQFRKLQLAVPRNALVNKQSKNSAYTNHAGRNKNCYLSGCIFDSEDCYYSDWIMKSKDMVDCSYIPRGSELCYETYYAWESYQAFSCDFIKRCQNVWFCYDCINVKNAFMCSNLRNKQYCLFNIQLSKTEYEVAIAKIFPLAFSELKKYRQEYIQMKDEEAIRPATYQIQTENCTGDLLFTSKNCVQSYDTIGTEDSTYCYDAIDVKNTMDVYHVGWAELMYECHAISNGYNCRFCHFTYDNSHATYCDCTQNCKNVFGCCGLNQKEYCILNKQYSKEKYEKLVPKIIEHMRKIPSTRSDCSHSSLSLRAQPSESKTGSQQSCEWGEFFPISFSPFAYNQSRAQEYYPLTKELATGKNIPWSEYESPLPQVEKTIPADQVPEHIADVPDDILNWGIVCEVSGKPFKIMKPELEFYRKNRLPIPRRHPDQRYLDRMTQRNPRKLWREKCKKCGVEIETSFAPEKPARVYCGSCYLGAVY